MEPLRMARKFIQLLVFVAFAVFFHGSVLAQDMPGTGKPDYQLGVGDLVRITVYGNPDLQTEARLTAQGTITFPLIGETQIGGISPQEAENKIAQALEKGGYLKRAQVNLLVTQFQSKIVSVLGDVNRPGKYPLDRPSRLSDALAMAAGVSGGGSDFVTLIINKAGKTVKETYDIRKMVGSADAANNPTLNGDEIIYVNAREVSVLGQVNRPGKYSVTSGVRSVVDFLSQAGGIAASGSDTVIVVTHKSGRAERIEIDVDNLYRSPDVTRANIELTDGDSIYVPRMAMFYIYGEVQRPGSFRLEKNMNVAQALSVGGGLTQRGTERGIKIKRQNKGKLETLDTNPGDLIKPDDIIYVGESLF